MTQFVIVHRWPDDNDLTIMPVVFTSEVAANIHRDHCAAIDHDRPGHVYSVARVNSSLHVREIKPVTAPDSAARKLSDEELSALARA